MLMLLHLHKIRVLIATVLFGIGIVGLCIYSWQQANAEQTNPQKPAKGLVAQVNEGMVQLGMIIPYCGKDLPQGYRWADGKSKWPEDASWLAEELRGKSVPNLNGRFLRGANDPGTLLSEGGREAQTNLKTEVDGAHSHAVPQIGVEGHTGLIARGDPGYAPKNADFSVFSEKGQWVNGGTYLETEPGGVGFGQHYHNLDRDHAKTVSATTQLDGTHSHVVSAFSILPSYVSVRFIIRVE